MQTSGRMGFGLVSSFGSQWQPWPWQISCYRAIASGEGDASNEHVCSGWSSGEPLGEAKRFRHYEAESFVLIFRPHLSRLIGEYRFAEL